MYIGRKSRIHPLSFRHRIRENFTPFFSEDHFLGIDPFDSSKFPSIYEPPTNVKEDQESYNVELMIPGFKKEEVDISIHDDCLVVAGNKESDITEENQDYIHHEHVVNGFRREFYLNPLTDRERIDAQFEDGVLRIVLYKNSNGKGQKKSIPIK